MESSANTISCLLKFSALRNHCTKVYITTILKNKLKLQLIIKSLLRMHEQEIGRVPLHNGGRLLVATPALIYLAFAPAAYALFSLLAWASKRFGWRLGGFVDVITDRGGRARLCISVAGQASAPVDRGRRLGRCKKPHSSFLAISAC